MKLNKQNKIIVGVLAFLLTLTVGYAVFSQSLNITGTAKAEGNFSLIFSSVGEIKQVGSTGATATRENSNKTLSVNVPNLQYPTAYVEIPAVIKNEGSISAQLDSINTEGLTEDDIKVTYKLLKDGKEINLEENNDVIESGKTRDIIITVTWDENSIKNEVTLEKFTISLNYKQYNGSLAEGDTSTINNCTEFTKKDTYSVGDVIAFCNTNAGKSEDFYVISDNGTTVTALAKYNLMVGNKAVYNEDLEDYIAEALTGSEEDYGLQSADTTFEVDSETELPTSTTLYGTIKFAEEDENRHITSGGNYYLGYWVDSNQSLLYGSTYPAYVYDENSNLYTPLQNYKTTLEGLKNSNGTNITVNEIRPIKYEELEGIGCNVSTSPMTCATETVTNNNRQWIYEGMNYWTASAYHSNAVWRVDYNGHFVSSLFWPDSFVGLRPVITISKSDI